MKILIIKPSSLGDVVQAFPVLRLLRQAHPEAQIDWWLAENLFPLLEDDPDLGRRIPFARKGWHTSAGMRQWCQTLGEIRDTRYDWVIDLQGLLRSGVLTWLARGAHSVGLDLRREGARLFYDQAVSRPTDRPHAVEWYLDVAKALGLEVNQLPEAIPVRHRHRETVLRQKGDDDRPLIALVPGARWENKRWPARHFAELTMLMDPQGTRYRFLVIGGSDDRDLAREMIGESRSSFVDLTGQTSIPEMIEWLREAVLVITNDTGPMHIAAGLKRPVIGLFGPTDPAQTGPYGGTSEMMRIDLPCAPCMKSRCRWNRHMECLEELTPKAVAATAGRMLK